MQTTTAEKETHAKIWACYVDKKYHEYTRPEKKKDSWRKGKKSRLDQT